jgi:hypothetical protein
VSAAAFYLLFVLAWVAVVFPPAWIPFAAVVFALMRAHSNRRHHYR